MHVGGVVALDAQNVDHLIGAADALRHGLTLDGRARPDSET